MKETGIISFVVLMKETQMKIDPHKERSAWNGLAQVCMKSS